MTTTRSPILARRSVPQRASVGRTAFAGADAAAIVAMATQTIRKDRRGGDQDLD